ncbi:MAG: hypothetical protein RIC55_01835 [Pirellulaceae bacterium]
MGRFSMLGVVLGFASMTAVVPSAFAGGNGCGCGTPRYSSCCGRAATSYQAAPRRQWIPAAPQGYVVPSVASFALAQPAVMVSPQFVTGQAYAVPAATQFVGASAFAVPQVYGSSLLTSGGLNSSMGSSGLSVSQLTKALKAVADAQAASAQGAEKQCSSSSASSQSASGGTLEEKIDRLEKSVDKLTETSQSILQMIQQHEQRLGKIESADQ